MEVSIDDVVALLDGRIEGASGVALTGFASIEDAGLGELTFLANPAYEAQLYKTTASAVLVSESLQLSAPVNSGTTLIRVDDPYAAMAKLMQAFSNSGDRDQKLPIDPTAVIHPDAKIGAGVKVGALSHIGAGAVIDKNSTIEAGVIVGQQAKLGEGCQIGPRSIIGRDCILGNGCILQAGAIVGADGFGFAPTDSGYEKIPQLGNVILGDDCEVGAGTTIDRATLGSTVLGRGVKLDNLIQIAHNVRIGDHTVIAAQTGIAGSTTIGERCMIGGQVGINGHIHIADGSKIAAKSGITASVIKPNQTLQGNPARPIKEHRRTQLALRSIIRNFETKQD